MRFLTGLMLLSASVLTAQTAVSLNGGPDGSTIEQGVPVILSLTTVNSSAAGAAADALEAVGPEGKRVALHYRSSASGESALGPSIVTRTEVWTLGPEATAALDPGTWSVRLPGADTREFCFRIAPAQADSADARSNRLLLLSAHAELSGDGAAAREAARQLVADQPESVAARLRLSDLLAEEGQYAEALRLLDEAESKVTGGKPVAHPPVMIRVRQNDILEKISAK